MQVKHPEPPRKGPWISGLGLLVAVGIVAILFFPQALKGAAFVLVSGFLMAFLALCLKQMMDWSREMTRAKRATLRRDVLIDSLRDTLAKFKETDKEIRRGAGIDKDKSVE